MASLHPFPDVVPRVPRGVRGIVWRVFTTPLLFLIAAYKRVLSPILPASCRFHPSCSAYGYEALALHGPVKGMALLVVRVLKCQPFHPGGFDPVPGSPLDARFLRDAQGRVVRDLGPGAHVHGPSCAHDDDAGAPVDEPRAVVGEDAAGDARGGA